MPTSKHRKNRKPHTRHTLQTVHTRPGLLPGPTDLPGVCERGVRLGGTQAHLFTAATVDQVVATLFHGWDLLGDRANTETLDGATHVFVLHRDRQWVGFPVVTGPDLPTGSPEPTADVHGRSVGQFSPYEYGWYMSTRSSRKTIRAWESLTGAERVRRVTDALRYGPYTDEPGPVRADNPVDFLAEVARRYDSTRLGEPVGHLRGLADVILRDDLPDPDGEVAAARMLAGLGGFTLP